ncbi:MAG: sterol desaturase family protein [Balneolaceae bacterium]
MDLIQNSLQESQMVILLSVLLLLFLWETVQPFYSWYRGSLRERGRHAVRNLVIGALNALMISLLFTGLWLGASLWAEAHRFGIMHGLQDLAGFPLLAHALGAILLLDLWTWLWHWMNHRIPFFWRFHTVHHSDNRMDVTTASRFHLGEILFSSIFRIPLIVLFGIYFWELVLYEVIMFAVVQFHHANIRLPASADRFLRAVIVTPNMHRVHHSRWQPETDSNYSSLFSFWDRLAGTFRLNPEPESIQLGLEGYDKDKDQSIRGMLDTPLRNRKSADKLD